MYNQNDLNTWESVPTGELHIEDVFNAVRNGNKLRVSPNVLYGLGCEYDEQKVRYADVELANIRGCPELAYYRQ